MESTEILFYKWQDSHESARNILKDLQKLEEQIESIKKNRSKEIVSEYADEITFIYQSYKELSIKLTDVQSNINSITQELTDRINLSNTESILIPSRNNIAGAVIYLEDGILKSMSRF